jgi:L-asparaginase II
MSDTKGQISDSALAMLKKAAEIVEVHHAFTRGKIKEWELENGGAWDASRFTERDMNMACALALFSECRVDEAVSLLQEAGIQIEETITKNLH